MNKMRNNAKYSKERQPAVISRAFCGLNPTAGGQKWCQARFFPAKGV